MKKILLYVVWFVGATILLVVLWRMFPADKVNIEQQTSESSAVEETLIILEPIQPIPLDTHQDPRKVALGSQLFNDVRLSRDNSISCASCHLLDKGGSDPRKRSIGINGQKGDVNAPTVFNSGFNFKQFWDGRSETLEEQAGVPTHNPVEMASNWEEIIRKLKVDPKYPSSFAAIYPDGMTGANISDAIATFERSLNTPNSRFDKFLRGDASALTDEEKLGYKLFKEYGCTVCHQGVNVGGNMFQGFGKFGNYFDDRGNIVKADLGRMNVTGDEKDRYKFKVPTLRNIDQTAPYFHDSAAETLEDAVRTMAKYQLGVSPEDREIQAIVKFLKSLTGEYKGKSLGVSE